MMWALRGQAGKECNYLPLSPHMYTNSLERLQETENEEHADVHYPLTSVSSADILLGL